MQDTMLETRCIHTIRLLAADAIERAQSGHPGLPMGAAPMAYTLFQHVLQHAPRTPNWPNRDRFVLSAGHGSMLLYSLMHLTGYPLSLEDLQSFRQLGSKCPGHPESFMTPGVEATTGPLGQGFANAVGMAMAERYMAQQYNRPDAQIIDHHTYVLVSDGDIMEGICAEAASLAGRLGLHKLVALYDANNITLDGPADASFTEDVAQRYQAYGWRVRTVLDGDNDLPALLAELQAARAQDQAPTLILVRTTIGYGAPHKQGSCKSHGAPLGTAELQATKKLFGFDPDASFVIPDDVAAHMQQVAVRGDTLQQAWQQRFASWRKRYPELAQTWDAAQKLQIPTDLAEKLPVFQPGEKMATRESSGQILSAIAQQLPWLFGGDADLSASTLTAIVGEKDFDGITGQGRNIRFGVREHAMGGILNGMAYHGSLRAYGATFFVFSDYMRPSIRLAALSHLPTIYIFTHDSVAVGEDGPTHQPIEHLMALRAMPNLLVFRPADATEAKYAWLATLQHTTGPVAMALSRQKLVTLDIAKLANNAEAAAQGVARGGYTLYESKGQGALSGILIASGSEVHMALAAAQQLERDGLRIRVVSLPCWELFAAQPQAYRDTVLPPAVTARVGIEAGVSLGWERWVQPHGAVLSIERFGLSAPAQSVLEALEFTSQHAAAKMRACIDAQGQYKL